MLPVALDKGGKPCLFKARRKEEGMCWTEGGSPAEQMLVGLAPKTWVSFFILFFFPLNGEPES